MIGRPTAIALIAAGVVLTATAMVLPWYSTAYAGGVEVVVRAWGTEILNKPGDWPAGELSPWYGVPVVVTAALLVAGVWISRAALAGAAGQLGAVGVIAALVMSERGHAVEQQGDFAVGFGLVFLAAGTLVALAGAVAVQREAT
ncbi:hypothetical protein SAMN04488074_14511 [Lentzea albidocapillata subsp. violacea]|uniref:Uncharacterized protein n=1 Tax=Lentzea albidocapillata subsp. violacea TaxID=128104 RepID=A0A1H0AAM7_9PSEU|nr:hypothetical protein [Lentzea albidocapillata]SDN30610.1 hypothetical protein SAMN04488074_14511 [Lentzea albidocapillata subsp. violacea]